MVIPAIVVLPITGAGIAANTLTNRRINHLESHNPTTTPTDHRGATA